MIGKAWALSRTVSRAHSTTGAPWGFKQSPSEVQQGMIKGASLGWGTWSNHNSQNDIREFAELSQKKNIWGIIKRNLCIFVQAFDNSFYLCANATPQTHGYNSVTSWRYVFMSRHQNHDFDDDSWRQLTWVFNSNATCSMMFSLIMWIHVRGSCAATIGYHSSVKEWMCFTRLPSSWSGFDSSAVGEYF